MNIALEWALHVEIFVLRSSFVFFSQFVKNSILIVNGSCLKKMFFCSNEKNEYRQFFVAQPTLKKHYMYVIKFYFSNFIQKVVVSYLIMSQTSSTSIV